MMFETVVYIQLVQYEKEGGFPDVNELASLAILKLIAQPGVTTKQ